MFKNHSTLILFSQVNRTVKLL